MSLVMRWKLHLIKWSYQTLVTLLQGLGSGRFYQLFPFFGCRSFLRCWSWNGWKKILGCNGAFRRGLSSLRWRNGNNQEIAYEAASLYIWRANQSKAEGKRLSFCIAWLSLLSFSAHPKIRRSGGGKEASSGRSTRRTLLLNKPRWEEFCIIKSHSCIEAKCGGNGMQYLSIRKSLKLNNSFKTEFWYRFSMSSLNVLFRLLHVLNLALKQWNLPSCL